MNRSGVVILAAVFIGLFSLLSGIVAGTFLGAKVVKEEAKNSAAFYR